MRIIPLLAVMLFSSLYAIAGGKITGKVTEEKSGETIIGATIIVKGTPHGTVTDVDGNFALAIDAGTYTLEVKYLGFKTKEIADVKVTNGSSTSLNISLGESDNTQLQEVVIRSSLKKENVNALYALQKNSASVSDGISADVIKKSPDRSTGEVLKRVSGTTIQDNKFVIVRGLSDRYNTALIDNAILPSTEPNRKAFSFDIIPANLIDNIVITKSGTPDLPGDFAGGVINILTKEIPEENFNTISIGTSYNTVSTFKTFKSGNHSSTDFLGFDNGLRQLPGNFPSTSKIINNNLSTTEQKNAEKSLNNDYTIKERSALPGISLQGSMGRSYLLKRNRSFGVIGAITYNHSETINGTTDNPMIRRYDNYDYKDNSYVYSTNVGGLLNFGYSFGKSKLVLKTLYNKVFDDNFLYRTGQNYGSSKYINYYAFDLVQKSLFKTSLEGDHQLGKGQSKINWIVSYNKITNNQPDQRKNTYFRDISSPDESLVADNSTVGKANNRFFSDLMENLYTGAVNYTLPVKLFNKTSLKAGVLGQYRDRSFDARYIGLKLNTIMNGADEVALRPLQTLYSNDIIDQGFYQLDDITSGSDKYDATNVSGAGYAMIDSRITDKFRTVLGVRAEYFNVKLNSTLSGAPLAINKTWVDPLPSVNFTYALTSKSNLRASYYKSVARPELREMAPFSYYDFEMSALVNGEPKLERTRIHNADLRYEIFPNAGEILSASVFYKFFRNTIENEVYSLGISQFEINPRNYYSAYNVGVEAEARKNLEFIARNSFLKNIVFYVNLAYIKSLVNDTSANSQDRPLSGQSNYVINTSLTYSVLDGKLNFNVLYNRIGQRIFLVGQGGGTAAASNSLGNAYENSRNLLDFQAAYNISKRSELRFNIKDLLNSPIVFYYDQNGNKKFDKVTYQEGVTDPTKDYVLKQYRPGSTFSLTYTYRF